MALARIYTARDELEAHFLKGILEQSGIAATVLGGALSAARGELPLTPQTLPGVWVEASLAARAAPLVEQYIRETYEQSPQPAGENWTCERCGQAIEGQFTQCWKCQAPRPGYEADYQGEDADVEGDEPDNDRDAREP
jgi:hypothetical protein